MHWVDDGNAGLLTDLYELTMAASYHASGMNGTATFDLFVRRLPERRNFLVACGIEDGLHYLETAGFEDEGIAYLRSLGMFREDFLQYLRGFQFTGEVWALPEGEVFFGNEPVMRVSGPLIEAQVVETFLLNCVVYQTLVASKAARISIACGDRSFVDFSPRRDHAADAALKAARASFVGGAVATSNVLGAIVYGMPPSGTMAHSYVLSFDYEIDAFRTFASHFPNNAVLLIDTYDTLEGARKAATVAREVAERGGQVHAVRLDSGDLAELAIGVRGILDEAGCHQVQIFASGDLDEYRIAKLLAAGAPIDAFGVGTQLGTSADEPALGAVYKLVDDEHGPKMKLSTGKVTLPGRKQVWRVERDGVIDHDVIGLEHETEEEGRPLLRPVMANGRRMSAPEPLAAARDRCAASLRALPPRLRSLEPAPEPYEVRLSAAIEEMVRIASGTAH